ncbi:MAG: ATP-binding protein [Myxococcota bacterium]|nr:ATP-binding protein [Myxococcota bacterium]
MSEPTTSHRDRKFGESLDGIFRPEVQRLFIHVVSLAAAAALLVGFAYSSIRSDVDLVRQIAFVIGVVAFLLSSLIVRLTQSAQWAAAILVVTGMGLTLIPAYYEGGVGSPYSLWFLVIPLLGGLMLGPRIAYLAGTTGVIAIAGLSFFADILPEPQGGPESTAMQTLNLVLAVVFCSAMGAIVSRLMTRSSLELTAARNAEIEKNQALAEINEQFEGSVNLASDAIIMAGKGGIIDVFNPAAEAMYGLRAEEAIGQKVAGLLIPERLVDDHLEGFKRFLETGVSNIIGLKLETSSLRPDGSEFPIELTVQEISGKKTSRFIAYIRDLTERNRLRSELDQKEQQIGLKRRLEAIGTLSGGIAHDFNNLLMAINGHTELLLLRDDLPRDALDGLREIARAGNQASSITKQLLAFSRSERLNTEHVNLTRMISALVDMVGRVLPDSVRLEVQLEEESWLVRSEGTRLEQAILNLILNAADAMPDGGRVQLRSRNVTVDSETAANIRELEVGDYGCVEVSDEGTGMDSETMEHAFDPFFTTKPTGEGTGLGLSTTYGIVQQSGGAIQIESKLGVGSTFRVYLPRATDIEEYYTEPDRETESPSGEDETVLVVEDNLAVRKLIVRNLASHGYHVIEASDGLRGYELALRHSSGIDLVVTDVVMPELGGAEMVRRLRLSLPDLRVIYVSGHSEDQLDSKDITGNRTEFLHKPFGLDTLAATVKRLLSD